ncbi:hypothetical protein [Nonomuraea sp. NPDC049784]|uniref:hypothetical protein n=1 Tax=Nonomuraea sp. NPDC049784 TaxID=3154361 RepID=UPI0033C9598B
MRRTMCGVAAALTLSITSLVAATTAVWATMGTNESAQQSQVVAGFNEPDQHD